VRATAPACLTSLVGELRTRLAGPDDALVVAALTLQCARHRGGEDHQGEQGFLDRYARAWLATGSAHPVWIAQAGEEHAGYLQAAVVEPLPWPGRPAGAGADLVVDTFFVRPEHRGIGVGEVLLKSAVQWARDAGFRQVLMAAGVHTRAMVERVGFIADARAYRMEL
jgi:GNAT superfamily N-acetyltransferase